MYRRVLCCHVLKALEPAPIENLKFHHVQMNGMHIVGEIHQFPDLRGAQHRLFA